MKIVGIICEYNPFHLGHEKQIRMIRQQSLGDCGIVCLMSGNYVQRGKPAIFDKSLRAEAALRCGADLVLELPVTSALSSAEGFAADGVKILSGFCDELCFGTENGTAETLMRTAQTLLQPEFNDALRMWLEAGISYPAARTAALADLGADTSLLESPNDILAVEYCKALIQQKAPMKPLPIRREGNYHDEIADTENPSATAVRALLESADRWQPFVPQYVTSLYSSAPLHTLCAGERALLARLRTMTDTEFEALPYGSEGLWRKLMHNCRCQPNLEEILQNTKSKRYTRSRLDRMVMCAYLGITAEDLAADAPYTRVLGFNSRGTAILKKAREFGFFPHTGDKTGHPYEAIEQRCDDLYGLFRTDSPAAGNSKRRVVILP